MFKIISIIAAMSALTLPARADGEYRHVVVFKFKPEATAEQITEVEKAFAALPGQIDAIKGFEWGTDVSPEGLSKGFTHCFLVTFDDAAGLKEYLPHPAHKAFGAKLEPVLEDAFVFDYVAK